MIIIETDTVTFILLGKTWSENGVLSFDISHRISVLILEYRRVPSRTCESVESGVREVHGDQIAVEDWALGRSLWFCSSVMIAMIEDLGPVLVQKFSSWAHNYQAESVGQQV